MSPNRPIELHVPGIGRVYGQQILTRKMIENEVQRLADNILEFLKDDKIRDITVVSIMTGSLVFTADLLRAFARTGDQTKLPQPMKSALQREREAISTRLELVSIRSANGKDRQTPTVNFRLLRKSSVHDKCVLLVDDIVDTGRTLHIAQRRLRRLQPKLLKTVVLLDKQHDEEREYEIKPDYVAFPNLPGPNDYAVGYGLDLNGAGRHFDWIGICDPKKPNRFKKR
jgi:hypoxanthine phosphoribosyltransferase